MMRWLEYCRRETHFPGGPLYKGGGGSAGEVGFADYVETVHKDWLGDTVSSNPIDSDIVAVMNSLFTTAATQGNPNPYFNSDAYDPTNDMLSITNAYNDLVGAGGYLMPRSHAGNRANQAEDDWDEVLFHVQDKIDNPSISLTAENISALVQTIVTANITNAAAVALQAITDSKTNTDTIVTGAIDKALEVLNSQPVTDTIKVFSDNLATQVNKIKSVFSAGMVDVNAVMSSAFIFGNSNIDVERVRSISAFTNNLINSLYNQVILAYIQMATGLSAQEINAFNNIFVNNLRGQTASDLQARQVRDARVDQHTNMVSTMLFGNIENELTRITAAQQVYNTRAINLFTRDQEDLRINAESQLWDLKVYQQGTNVLGGMNTGGGTFIPEGANPTSLAAGGALAGALAGAKIGSMVPGVGTAIGAGVGAVLGAAAGFFN